MDAAIDTGNLACELSYVLFLAAGRGASRQLCEAVSLAAADIKEGQTSSWLLDLALVVVVDTALQCISHIGIGI